MVVLSTDGWFYYSYMYYSGFYADLYLSPFEDWVGITSIVGVIWVVHADIGESQRGT